MRVVRKNERSSSTFNHLKIEHLTSQGKLRMMSVEFPPGASMGELHAHEGEECHIVHGRKSFSRTRRGFDNCRGRRFL